MKNIKAVISAAIYTILIIFAVFLLTTLLKTRPDILLIAVIAIWVFVAVASLFYGLYQAFKEE